jgi:hypothetical protein
LGPFEGEGVSHIAHVNNHPIGENSTTLVTLLIGDAVDPSILSSKIENERKKSDPEFFPRTQFFGYWLNVLQITPRFFSARLSSRQFANETRKVSPETEMLH